MVTWRFLLTLSPVGRNNRTTIANEAGYHAMRTILFKSIGQDTVISLKPGLKIARTESSQCDGQAATRLRRLRFQRFRARPDQSYS